jgi:hypothetical protein
VFVERIVGLQGGGLELCLCREGGAVMKDEQSASSSVGLRDKIHYQLL